LGYASPIAVTIHGKRQVVCYSGQAVMGIEPAGGKLLWRFQWGNRFNCNCATPLVVDNLVFVSSAYGAGAAAVQIDKDGAGFKATKKWTAKQFQNQFATSVILDGYLYGCHGDLGATMLRCFDLKTGQEQWTSRDP